MKILIVEDEYESRRELIQFIVNHTGHEVSEAGNGVEALQLLKQQSFQMMLTDIRMPEMNGLQLLETIQRNPLGSDMDIVMMTSYADIDTSIKSMRLGARDYLIKPISLSELEVLIYQVAERHSLLTENRELKQHLDEKVEEVIGETRQRYKELQRAYAEVVGIGQIVVQSRRMRDIIQQVEQYHTDRAIPVLIEGETGTGKEIIARLIHYGKECVSTPFISLNCSAIAPTLFESELFGYEGGAFTGSSQKGQRGKLELAERGTVFLDEIGELPLEMQPKLLRVLQEKEFYRVGGLKQIKLNVRLIFATNQNLPELVRSHKFRKDLFYRLNVGRIILPPLRERKEEIVPMAHLFLHEFTTQKKRQFIDFTPEAEQMLERYNWPGNVRELRHAIERVVVLHNRPKVQADDLQFILENDIFLPQENPSAPLADTDKPPMKIDLSRNIDIKLPEDELNLDLLEKFIVAKTLDKFNGNKTKAAEYLGLTRSALRSRME